jgi:DNA-binding transcriptional regulator YiaG
MLYFISYGMKYVVHTSTSRGATKEMSPSQSPQPPPLTSAQIRAARALIRWSAEELARHSAVSVTTVRRAELRASATVLTRANDQAIRRALEQAGVEFIDADNAGPGVRLRAP